MDDNPILHTGINEKREKATILMKGNCQERKSRLKRIEI